MVGLGYRHGNFRRVGIERLDEGRKRFRVCRAKAESMLGNDNSCVHAIPFPVQLPEPSPSGAGAGWAIGVALP